MCVENKQIILYAIIVIDPTSPHNGKYYAGFDPIANAPKHVECILDAKLHTTTSDIKLKSNEFIDQIELSVTRDDVSFVKRFKRSRKKHHN